jgi:hypothetical protein
MNEVTLSLEESVNVIRQVARNLHFRSNDRRYLCQQLSPKLLRFRRQARPLLVIKPQTPIPDLFAQNPIFLHDIFDNLLLVPVHPTGNRVARNEMG